MTVIDTAAALAGGELVVDSGRRAAELAAELVARPGIGPWTADYVLMRVLGDPDVLLVSDLVLRKGARVLGLPDDPTALAARAERWRPFRSYAGLHLWRANHDGTTNPVTKTTQEDNQEKDIQEKDTGKKDRRRRIRMNTSARWTVTDTQAGPFGTIVEDDGTVLASGWTADSDRLLEVIHQQLRPTALLRVDTIDGVTENVIAYHNGDLDVIDQVRVRQRSGPYLEQAWDVLRQIPAGAPISYTDFAAKTGHPEAVRAAASACARNAAALFVPCHRVLRNDGSLGGFRWGLDVKRWLLDHES